MGAGLGKNRPLDGGRLAVALLANFTLLGCFYAARVGAFFASFGCFVTAGAVFVFRLVSGEGDGNGHESECKDTKCFLHRDVVLSLWLRSDQPPVPSEERWLILRTHDCGRYSVQNAIMN